jgi:hypothetical protein
MTQEFNLSKRIQEVNDYELDNQVHPATKTDVIEVDDIQEFIRKLKMEIDSIDFEIIGLRGLVKNKIDKLAGDKLI